MSPKSISDAMKAKGEAWALSSSPSKEALAEVREALEFYADRDTYCEWSNDPLRGFEKDGMGNRARAALSRLGNASFDITDVMPCGHSYDWEAGGPRQEDPSADTYCIRCLSDQNVAEEAFEQGWKECEAEALALLPSEPEPVKCSCVWRRADPDREGFYSVCIHCGEGRFPADEPPKCETCDGKGFLEDALSSAMGGNPWRDCPDCEPAAAEDVDEAVFVDTDPEPAAPQEPADAVAVMVEAARLLRASCTDDGTFRRGVSEKSKLVIAEQLEKCTPPSPVEPAEGEYKADYKNACELVAAMHHAAMGVCCAPKLGVVEDVVALREERDALKFPMDNYRAWYRDSEVRLEKIKEVMEGYGE